MKVYLYRQPKPTLPTRSGGKFLSVWLRSFVGGLVVVIVAAFLLANFFDVSWSIKGVRAVYKGLGVTFPNSFGTNLVATVFNDRGSSFAEGQQVSAEFGFYHCNTTGGGVCAPDQTPSDIRGTERRQITITAPAQGESSQMSFPVSSVDCGRAQVDIGLPGGSPSDERILGGKVYSFGSNCSPPPGQPTPTQPSPTNPPELSDSANCVSVSVNDNKLEAGKMYQATVVMRNDGGSWIWDGPNPYRLGSQDPENNTLWSIGRVDLPHSPITAGNTATFKFNIWSPEKPGAYPFNWRMVKEGAHWFGGKCQQNVTVVSPTPSPCPVVATPTGLSPKGQTLPAGTGSVTLSWQPVANAVAYEVGFKTRDGKTLYENDSVRDTQVTVNLVEGVKEYGWWVYAKSSCGKSSPENASFTVDTVSVVPQCLSLTASPTAVAIGETLRLTPRVTNGHLLDSVRLLYYNPAGQQPSSDTGWTDIGRVSVSSQEISWDTNQATPGNHVIGMVVYNKSGQVTDGWSKNNACRTTVTFNQSIGGVPSVTMDKVVVFGGSEYNDLSSSINRFESGERVSFRIKVVNNSDVNVDNLQIVDDLPLWLDAASTGSAAVSANRKHLSWNISRLSGRDSRTLDYTAEVRSDLPGGETNQRNSSRLSATSIVDLVDSSSVVIFKETGQLYCNIFASPGSGRAPLSVSFEGQASVPSGRSISSYSWDFTNDGSIDASGRTSSFIYRLPGTHTVRLRVIDSSGSSNQCFESIVVTQQEQPSSTSCSLSGIPNVQTLGSPVTLTAVFNSGGDPSRVPTKYVFAFGDGTTVDNQGSASTQKTYQSPGLFFPQVTISDSKGGQTSCPSVVTITAQPGQLSCAISASPPSGTAPLGVNFQAITNIPAGRSISSYQWDFTNDGAFDASGQQASFTFQNSGNYTAKLQITDSTGVSASCLATIVVHQPTGGSPSVKLNKVVLYNNTEYDNIGASTKKFESGNTIVYRVKISNSSGTAASNMVVVDDLPTWLDVSSMGSGTSSGKRVTWNLGTLGANTNLTLEYSAVVRSDLPAGETTQHNSVNATGSNFSPLADSTSVVIFRQPSAGEPVVSVTKTPLSQSVEPGREVSFTIRIRNNSGRELSGIQVFDDLPVGFSYVSGSTTGSTTANPSIADHTLSWPSFTLANGSEWSVSLKANAATIGGTYINQARASAENKVFGPSQTFVFVSLPKVVATAAGGEIKGVTTLPKTGPELLLVGGIPALFGAGWRLRKFGHRQADCGSYRLMIDRLERKRRTSII